ncbi:DUF5079 family protein [Staphylococcus caeli]|uniref:Lipoprotein, putative n=1 Tax=Staphylococcus caeli TaxID=2201815 RepID=A0A1D4JXF5_9STAP|nr:DUF5079 family protein [Staphylococcus caeli]SCS66287.1 lipoprotein, putative [Staphylococcus caeli]SCS86598.1 lipoprotein, putative [Staphylococcus caeli]
MDINKSIDELRKPATQVVSLFALLMILLSSVTLFNGLDYDRLPNYLKLITIIELVLIFMSLLQFFRFINFEKDSYKNKKTLKRYAKFLTAINVIGTFNAAFAFSNVFYYIAVQNYVDLYHYWLLSTISMIVCLVLLSIGAILMYIEMPKVERYVSGKTKTLIGIGLVFLSFLLYLERVVEYFLVPNIAESKFMVLGSILILLGVYLVSFTWITKYADFKILVLKE